MGCTSSKPSVSEPAHTVPSERTSIPNPAAKRASINEGSGSQAGPTTVSEVVAEAAQDEKAPVVAEASSVHTTSSKGPTESAPKSPAPEAAAPVARKKIKKPKVSTGRLMKEGQKVKNWKERFFILKEGKLSYYNREIPPKTNKGEELLGELYLKGYVVTEPSVNKFLLSHPTDTTARKLLLEQVDDNCRRAWINVLRDHIRWLDERDAEEANASVSASSGSTGH